MKTIADLEMRAPHGHGGQNKGQVNEEDNRRCCARGRAVGV